MFAFLITAIIGITITSLGILTLNGTYKRWYLGPLIFPPQAWMYGQIPMGIGFLWMSFTVLLNMVFELDPDLSAKIFLAVGAPAFISAVVLAMWRPRWIRPQWVKWIEDNHRWLEVQWLIADARKDPQGWGNRVSTQKGLEGWAREVLNKHPQPGDMIFWYKGYDGDFIEARVLKNTEKRVKIEYVENGQTQTRYVQSNSLKVKRSLE